jgi:hypothetical protein
MKKIQIEEKYTVNNLIDGNIGDTIAVLEMYKQQGWQHIEYYSTDIFDDQAHIYILSRRRPETDQEYEERLKRAELNKKKKQIQKESGKEIRRKQYQKLKKEFES